MPAIIKAGKRCRENQAVAFNFDDMAGQANEYLRQVRAEAAKIIAEAERDAVRIRKEAETEGERAGRAAIEQIVQKQLAGELETLLPALRETIGQIGDAKQAWLSHWEKNAVHVAVAIASRLIRRELPGAPEITLTLIREALELAAGSSHLRIHLNPADHKTLGEQVAALIKEISSISEAEVVADGEVTPGGCRVQTKFGVIDQRFETQLSRIEEELTLGD